MTIDPPQRKLNWFMRLNAWGQAGIVIAVMLLFSCLAGAVLNKSPTLQAQPITNVPVETTVASPAAAAPVHVVAPVTITGSSVSVVEIGAVLNGSFRVDYSFGSWCGIVHFLKANGSDGSGPFGHINDCAADSDIALAGSTVVRLTNVTMVQVDNTRGAWSLTFTPLG